MGALLDKFTTLEDRDISVLVTSGDETTLSSQMAGKIKKVNYGLGDNVAAKAVLLEFDCEEQDAQLQSAEAEYRGARETHLTKLRLQALGAALEDLGRRLEPEQGPGQQDLAGGWRLRWERNTMDLQAPGDQEHGDG